LRVRSGLARAQQASGARNLILADYDLDATLRATTVFDAATAASLKSMALQGMGVAWVPRVSVTGEPARSERVTCGGEHWQVLLKIRLSRCALVRKASVRLRWRKLESAAVSG
jgi:DNA-binding transcriptional LysR family regulator